MAEPGTKRRKVMSLESRQKKRERDKHFAKTRVNIGAAYTRWKEIKEATKSRTDGDLALLLLDFYQTRQVASTPSKTELLQEEPEPPQIKEEQEEPEPLPILEHEELCIKQDKEQSTLKLETVTFDVTPTDEERDQDEPKPNTHQLLFSRFPESEIQNQDGRTHHFKLPQHHTWEKEVLTDQQLCDHETTSSLDQEEPEPPLMKEEQQEFFISQPEGQFILKQENVTFMVTSPSEQTDSCKPEPNKNKPWCLIFPEAENQDQDGCRNSESKSNEQLKQNKRCKQTRDHRNNVDSYRGEKPFLLKTYGKRFS